MTTRKQVKAAAAKSYPSLKPNAIVNDESDERDGGIENVGHKPVHQVGA
jgi:hypothetical protein